MKSIYWRPKKVSVITTFVIGLVAAIMLIVVEVAPRFSTQANHQELQAANQLGQLCRYQIREHRRELGLSIQELFDPTESGLIGKTMTPLTSKPALVETKQLSLHPQFPAAVVSMLQAAGVRKGDVIAVGWTGSFPGLNVALSSAVETLELEPIVVASVTASQYGANQPELTWLDMESRLHEAGLISFRSKAATIGGPLDSGKGMSKDAKNLAIAAMDRNDVSQLKTKGLSQSIDRRMKVIDRNAKGRPVVAYINVGGGVASCGGRDGRFETGLQKSENANEVDCVMQRFCERGVPVIHLARPHELASKFDLSSDVESWASLNTPLPTQAPPNQFLALAMLVLLGLVLQAFILKDVGHRILVSVASMFRQRPYVRAVGQTNGPQMMA